MYISVRRSHESTFSGNVVDYQLPKMKPRSLQSRILGEKVCHMCSNSVAIRVVRLRGSDFRKNCFSAQIKKKKKKKFLGSHVAFKISPKCEKLGHVYGNLAAVRVFVLGETNFEKIVCSA